MTEPVALLWTGGWDSTFRLLDLAVTHGRGVQPFYVRSPGRPSTDMELATMARIHHALRLEHPGAADLIRPLDADTTVPAIAPDPAVTASFQRLRARSHLGDQYDYLARFAAERKLDALELAIHRDDRAAAFLDGHVQRASAAPPDDVHALVPEPADPDLAIFRRFRFPLFEVTKLQMQARARERGVANVLELTWFCHEPIHGRPCGACNPCRYTRQEGLGRRVPRAPLRRAVGASRRAVGRGLRATPGLERLVRRR